MEIETPTQSIDFCDSSHSQVTPDDRDGLLFVRVGTIYGGYDPEFFMENMEDHFVCPICKGILSSPTLIVECGHVFCEKCIQENNRLVILALNYYTMNLCRSYLNYFWELRQEELGQMLF